MTGPLGADPLPQLPPQPAVLGPLLGLPDDGPEDVIGGLALLPGDEGRGQVAALAQLDLMAVGVAPEQLQKDGQPINARGFRFGRGRMGLESGIVLYMLIIFTPVPPFLR